MQIEKQFGFGHVATDALEIRLAVFNKEQGFSISDELDGLDETTTHYVGYLTPDEPITTARISKDKPGNWHIQRVATTKAARGKGYSTALLKQVEADAREKHVKTLDLGAQIQAKGFYEALGYQVVGEQFLDAGAPHVRMVKELTR
ncbi:GNAT family N-acetyltransferase [Periweissella cryptocerci]|uniref:GNAT family N-acetyltransferase n=1 Tax=Periweissella cryptocerci TaxID=2506420 RepID=A0A4P6YUQ8_9LACO|nr:GNAT family N-acetyltransferase [Periweissella cryptocerci]QBO36471.1 GNAT family N-acetyltransferase [Periweissella cryptocerci]